jgi:hypothetical protein
MRPAITKTVGIVVAAFGIVVPVLILPLRGHFCRRFEVGSFDFYPLSGVVSGYSPELLTRIMHNLTHPLLILAYAAVMVSVATRAVVHRADGASREHLLIGLLFVHIAYLGMYSYSISLPVGDLVISIKQ